MVKMIAHCGLDCGKCNAYKATVKNSDELRKKTAETWAKQFNSKITPKDINCKGCTSKETLFSYCNVCEIRKCGISKKIDNCASCADYACETLNKMLSHAPEAKTNLDSIKNKKGR